MDQYVADLLDTSKGIVGRVGQINDYFVERRQVSIVIQSVVAPIESFQRIKEAIDSPYSDLSPETFSGLPKVHYSDAWTTDEEVLARVALSGYAAMLNTGGGVYVLGVRRLTTHASDRLSSKTNSMTSARLAPFHHELIGEMRIVTVDDDETDPDARGYLIWPTPFARSSGCMFAVDSQFYTIETNQVVNIRPAIIELGDKTDISRVSQVMQPDSGWFRHFREAFAPKTEIPITRRHAESYIDDVCQQLRDGSVVFVSGPPGCGKSSVLSAGIASRLMVHGRNARVIHSQPTRLQVTELYAGVRQFLADRVGTFEYLPPDQIGYHIGGDRTEGTPQLMFCTTAILTHNIPAANATHTRWDVYIIDEAHIRDHHMAMALARIREAMHTNDTVRLVVMSATLEHASLQQYYDGYGRHGGLPEVLKVGVPNPLPPGGQLLPAVRYRYALDDLELRKMYKIDTSHIVPGEILSPLYSTSIITLAADLAVDQALAFCRVSTRHAQSSELRSMSIIVFVPGWTAADAVISRIHAALSPTDMVSVAPVLGSMSLAEQQASMAPAGRDTVVRILVTTNALESSVTISDAAIVYDTCLEYQAMSDRGVTALELRLASRSSLIQRAGRIGRTRRGWVVRLLRQMDVARLRPNPAPGIQTAAIDDTVLELLADQRASLDLLLEMPDVADQSRVRDAVNRLHLEGLVSVSPGTGVEGPDVGITASGRFLTALPIPLGAARVVYLGCRMDATDDAVVIAAACATRHYAMLSRGARGAAAWRAAARYCGGTRSDVIIIANTYLDFLRFMTQTAAGDVSKLPAWARARTIDITDIKALHTTVLRIRAKLHMLGLATAPSAKDLDLQTKLKRVAGGKRQEHTRFWVSDDIATEMYRVQTDTQPAPPPPVTIHERQPAPAPPRRRTTPDEPPVIGRRVDFAAGHYPMLNLETGRGRVTLMLALVTVAFGSTVARATPDRSLDISEGRLPVGSRQVGLMTTIKPEERAELSGIASRAPGIEALWGMGAEFELTNGDVRGVLRVEDDGDFSEEDGPTVDPPLLIDHRIVATLKGRFERTTRKPVAHRASFYHGSCALTPVIPRPPLTALPVAQSFATPILLERPGYLVATHDVLLRGTSDRPDVLLLSGLTLLPASFTNVEVAVTLLTFKNASIFRRPIADPNLAPAACRAHMEVMYRPVLDPPNSRGAVWTRVIGDVDQRVQDHIQAPDPNLQRRLLAVMTRGAPSADRGRDWLNTWPVMEFDAGGRRPWNNPNDPHYLYIGSQVPRPGKRKLVDTLSDQDLPQSPPATPGRQWAAGTLNDYMSYSQHVTPMGPTPPRPARMAQTPLGATPLGVGPARLGAWEEGDSDSGTDEGEMEDYVV